MVRLRVAVNGRVHEGDIDPRTMLVDYLREHLGLTGVHIGCRTGNCGACTVLLDGSTVKSCCILAADVDDQEITTVEALATGPDDLHPIQQAFVEQQGLQCGFCTPGMLLSALKLLETSPDPTPEEIRQGISGNLCRCTGYQFIVDSIQTAAQMMSGASSQPEGDG